MIKLILFITTAATMAIGGTLGYRVGNGSIPQKSEIEGFGFTMKITKDKEKV